MGRGKELADALMRRAAEEGSIEARRRRLRPEMRLAPDVVVDADSKTRAREALGQLAADGVNCVEVRDTETGMDAVLIPAERYVELMTRLLAAEPPEIAHEHGHPRYPSGIADVNLEQVDPNASWDTYFRFNPRANSQANQT